jgi:hypothetical protein
MWGALLISRFETGNMVISDERGQDAPEHLGPRAVLFSHFDRHGHIRDHTRAYVDALRSEGLDVVFVSNSQRLAPLDLAWVRTRAARIMVRRNLGYDFAAWRDAMAACGLPAANTTLLVLANDSVYGPWGRLRSVLDQLDFNKADVWGVTDSWQHRFHLQSFFVAFGPKALDHDAFKLFWSSVRNVRWKACVVWRYEVGLSRSLIGAGLRCKAIWSYLGMIEALRKAAAEHENRDSLPSDRRASGFTPEHGKNQIGEDNLFTRAGRDNAERLLRIADRRIPLNPTADLWRVLIEHGFPFLKRELLRDNPSRVPDVAAWSSVVDEIGEFDRDIILRDLETTLKNRTP